MIDTHSHIFLEEFDADRDAVVKRAHEAGVTHIFMPNIDSTTVTPLLKTCDDYPDYCFPMAGLHPTSITAENLQQELASVEEELRLRRNRYCAVGEIGMDLYWDKTYLSEQVQAFRNQIELALRYDLPVVIHCREAFTYIYKVLQEFACQGARGVFHSFTGTKEEADLILSFPGFYLGVNGIITFKKSPLPEVLRQLPVERIVLETDCPYLTPVPFRGQRNETSFVQYTLRRVAEVYGMSEENLSEITSNNALHLFGMA